jgi:Beta propeller domain
VGRAPGSLLNDYAVDVVDNIIRIGTSVVGQPCCCVPIPATKNDATNTMSTNATTSEDNTTFGNSTETTPELDQALLSSSSSLPSVIEMLGHLQVGKKNEEFAARFIRVFDNIAYVVTEMQLGRIIYVLDLSDPTNPQKTWNIRCK